MLVVILSSIMFSSCFQVTKEEQKNIIDSINNIVETDNTLFDVEVLPVAPPLELQYYLYVDSEKFFNQPKEFIEYIHSNILEQIKTYLTQNEEASNKDISIILSLRSKNKEELLKIKLLNGENNFPIEIYFAKELYLEALESLSDEITSFSGAINQKDNDKIEHFPALKSLRGICVSTDEDISRLIKMKNLESLSMEITNYVPVNNLSKLNIKSLEIFCTQEDHYPKLDFSSCKSFTNLETLVIFSKKITDEEKDEIIKSLKKCYVNIVNSNQIL